MLTINGFMFQQRDEDDATKVFVFNIKAKELLKYSIVEPVERGTEGIQRLLVPIRVKKIKSFFDKEGNEKNIIPNTIIVAVDKNPTDESTDNKLIFDVSEDEKFIKIIDGQHRLEGMAQSDSNLNILVTAFIEPSSTEQAFQFLVINNKSHKVPPVHVKALVANYEAIESDLQKRLNNVGITFNQIPDIDLVDREDESPLKGFIKWVNNEDGILAITAIERAFLYIVDRIPEAREDDSIKRDILYQVWNANKELFPEMWEEQKINHLLEKSSFIVLTIILIDYTFSYCDTKSDMTGEEITVMDENIFFEASKIFLKKFPKDFWLKEWTKKGLDTDAGRILIKKSITQIKSNIRNRETDLLKNVVLLK